MNKHQYFYLISGLPDLSIEDRHIPFPAKMFLNELMTKIYPEDFEFVCWLYYVRDNKNLISVLFNKKTTNQPEGRYSLQQLEKAIESPSGLPGYMSKFISFVKENNKQQYSEDEWEVRLTEAYFREAMNSGNKMLNQWLEFELNLKNLFLELNIGRSQPNPPRFIIEANESAALFQQNPSADFSTETTLGYYGAVVEIIKMENIVEREKKLDGLRWQQLEEMNFFNYFTVEAVLGFCVKLMMLERWEILNQNEIKLVLPTIIETFINEIEMPHSKTSIIQ